MPKRREINWSLKEHRSNGYREGEWRTSDITLTFTRKGIAIDGYYDSMVGIGNCVLLEWSEIDEYRQALNATANGPRIDGDERNGH